MGTSEIVFYFFFSFLFYLPHKASAEVCPTNVCDSSGPKIRFPFHLRYQQLYLCSYPGFGLSCNNQSQTIINLPSAGRFIVQRINYTGQEISVRDPGNCLPKRLLDHMSFSDYPFDGTPLEKYTILNCSFPDFPLYVSGYKKIDCLSGPNYNVLAVPSRYADDFMLRLCHNYSSVVAPSQWLESPNFSSDMRLAWSEPNCGPCERRGGVCGFKNDGSREIECSVQPSHGLPRSAKYGIIIGVGIPGLVCMFGIVCYICGRINNYGRRRHHPNTELSTSIAPQPGVVLLGLDGPTIESFPKTVLGESRRLPKPSDGTCPICLSEYQPKDTLRTIPECNHYFHADCIDEWLRMNATCPICRNSPDGSSLVTPCSPSSASSLSLSSSSS